MDDFDHDGIDDHEIGGLLRDAVSGYEAPANFRHQVDTRARRQTQRERSGRAVGMAAAIVVLLLGVAALARGGSLPETTVQMPAGQGTGAPGSSPPGTVPGVCAAATFPGTTMPAPGITYPTYPGVADSPALPVDPTIPGSPDLPTEPVSTTFPGIADSPSLPIDPTIPGGPGLSTDPAPAPSLDPVEPMPWPPDVRTNGVVSFVSELNGCVWIVVEGMVSLPVGDDVVACPDGASLLSAFRTSDVAAELSMDQNVTMRVHRCLDEWVQATVDSWPAESGPRSLRFHRVGGQWVVVEVGTGTTTCESLPPEVSRAPFCADGGVPPTAPPLPTTVP